ncbi:hypothetical protein XENOCAPTIV_026527, partial [Xenoophorus captivus]
SQPVCRGCHRYCSAHHADTCETARDLYEAALLELQVSFQYYRPELIGEQAGEPGSPPPHLLLDYGLSDRPLLEDESRIPPVFSGGTTVCMVHHQQPYLEHLQVKGTKYGL